MQILVFVKIERKLAPSYQYLLSWMFLLLQKTLQILFQVDVVWLIKFFWILFNSPLVTALLKLTLLILIFSLYNSNNIKNNFRTLELSFMFLLVWYYCTLTIRESILKVNGSRIKGWWRFHHFLSTVVSGVLLVWPNTGAWYSFRGQFMWFNVYISKFPYKHHFLKEMFSQFLTKFYSSLLYRCSTISSISISTGSSLSIKGIGWKTQYGHYDRRLSFMDVARTVLPSTVPFYGLRLSTLQCLHVIYSVLTFGSHVACSSS